MADIFVSPWPLGELAVPEPQELTGTASFNFSLGLAVASSSTDNFVSTTLMLGMRSTGLVYAPDPLWLKSVVPQMIPAHIFEDYPRFVDLIETWCDFVEKRYDENNIENPGSYYPIKYFDKLVDLDETRDDLLEWFKRTFAVTIPQFTAADTRLLIKNAVRFYVSRGTKDSIKFLLNTFFGDASATVYEPKVDLLRLSDATWYQPRLLALNAIDNPLVPVSALVLSSLYDQVLENPITFARGYVGNSQIYSGTPVIELLDKFGLFLPGDI